MSTRAFPAALLSPAVARNRDPILAVLRRHLPEQGTVLEIASGTGEHAAYFAPQFPHLTWQPSDVDPEALASIEAHRAAANAPNLRAPIALDVTAPAWPVTRADAVVSINMIHISPWTAAQGLMAGAARLLAARRRALSLRAVQGERRTHGAKQCGVRREPAGARSAMGRARHRRRPRARRQPWFRFRRARRDAGEQSEPRVSGGADARRASLLQPCQTIHISASRISSHAISPNIVS